MIHTASETVISLTEAAKILPKRRGGKRPNVCTVYRWTSDGCRGVVLESVQIGGTRCTSREALDRFFAALTAQAGVCPSTPAIRTTTQRQRASERAARHLEAAGI
jgi:hypothetical protein